MWNNILSACVFSELHYARQNLSKEMENTIPDLKTVVLSTSSSKTSSVA